MLTKKQKIKLIFLTQNEYFGKKLSDIEDRWEDLKDKSFLELKEMFNDESLNEFENDYKINKLLSVFNSDSRLVRIC